MFRYVAFLLIVSAVSCQRGKAVYKPCGGSGKLISVEVEPCDSDPCVFKMGTDAKIHVTMVADQDSETATLDARVKVFGFQMPVPGIETDLCKGTVECPVIKGRTYNTTTVFSVPSLMSLKTEVTVKVIGDKGLSICGIADIVIE
ncbi:mite group 2 allergen-like Ixo r 2 [Ixodes scapularis]